MQVHVGYMTQHPGNVSYIDEDELRINSQNGDKEGINVVVVVLAAVLAVVVTGVLIIGQLSEIPTNASVWPYVLYERMEYSRLVHLSTLITYTDVYVFIIILYLVLTYGPDVLGTFSKYVWYIIADTSVDNKTHL